MDKFTSEVAEAIGAGQQRAGPRLLPPREFLELASDEVTRALRYDRPLSVILMVIDEFASFRDAHGIESAEVRFARVRDLVLGTLRTQDRTGRLGRGELGALLPETTLTNAVLAAERLNLQLAREALPQVTLSMGLAALSPRMRDAKTFLMTACFELRQAQNKGAGAISVAEPEVVKVSVPRSGAIH